MSYSKKIFLLYRSYEFRIKEIDEDIRRICVRSFGVNNSVERIFDRVCVKAKEKDDLFLIAEKVEAVLKRLRKKDREILLYRYMNVFPEDSDKKIFSRSGFYRRLSIAEAIFEEYLSYVGLDEGTFEKKYGAYPWARRKVRLGIKLNGFIKTTGSADEITHNPFFARRRGRPKRVSSQKHNATKKEGARAKENAAKAALIGGVSQLKGVCLSAVKTKPVTVKFFPTKLA